MSERTCHTNGVDLHLTEQGEGSPVFLCHGFPELSYSWRHQIPAIAAAGYHVVAPDQRGYGKSSRPDAIEDYDIVHLTDDLLGVLDDLGHEKAVFIGHDWGSMVVWAMSQLHPDRVAGVMGMSVPFLPRAERPPTETMRFLFGDAFFYMLYFQEPGVADRNLGADPERTMRGMLAGLSMDNMAGEGEGEGEPVDPTAMFAADDRGFVERLPNPKTLPPWLSQDELDHYVAEFTRTGFTGGINWYRNLDRNWSRTEQLAGAKVTVPAAFLGGALDPVLMMTPPSVQDGWLEDDRGSLIVEGAGHWVQQEKPDEVNAFVLEFLRGLPQGW